MFRILVLLTSVASLLSSSASGQAFAPRSMDYLFAATANDARAIWLNPAGLAVVPEASVMAELVVHRSPDANLRLSQLSLGFNSQGLSMAYNRERLVSDSSNHTYRIAMARALQGWTIGFSMSYFRNGVNDTGYDAGIRYRLLRTVDLGVVVRNIGQPQIRTDTLPVTGVAGLGWTVLGGALVLSGETLAQNRLDESGYTMSYRAGARLSVGRRIPIVGLTAVHLDNDLGVTRWSFGVTLGGLRQIVMVGGVSAGDPSVRLENVSVAGIATNPLTAWRRR